MFQTCFLIPTLGRSCINTNCWVSLLVTRAWKLHRFKSDDWENGRHLVTRWRSTDERSEVFQLLTLHMNPLSHPRISHTSSEHCTISTESVSHLHLLAMRMTYPAVPMRTSWVLTLGKLPITNAKINIDKETVTDVKNRLIGIQRSRNTGISNVPTTNVALTARVVTLNLLLGRWYLVVKVIFERSMPVERLSLALQYEKKIWL